MGRGANLPEPLETPSLGSAPNADDLLAQMAGDEIDRLLAEADVEQQQAVNDAQADPPPSPLAALGTEGESANRRESADSVALPIENQKSEIENSPVSPGGSTAGLDDETARQLDALFEQLTADDSVPASPPRPLPALGKEETGSEGEGEMGRGEDKETSRQGDKETDSADLPIENRKSKIKTPPISPPAPVETSPELARQLDELFEQLNAPLPSESTPAAQPAPAAALPVAEEEPRLPAAARAVSPEEKLAREATLSAGKDPAEQTGALEQQVLRAEVLTENEPQAQDEPEIDEFQTPARRALFVDEEEAEERVAFYLRPLIWINRPLWGCSDAMRDLLAKMALLNLVAALGILLFVMLFRK